MDLFVSGPADFPYDIFLLIISYLSPAETLLCRRVSRAWNKAFTTDHLSWTLMRMYFPNVWEMRDAIRAQSNPDWSSVYLNVVHRHHRLQTAEAKSIEKINITPGSEQDRRFCEIEPWDRELHFVGSPEDKQKGAEAAIFQYGNSDWCLDDGLLIYRERGFNNYIAYDLQTRSRHSVPFYVADKTVRRLRLADGILVFEWCKRMPSSPVDNQGQFSRHFVTAFDVQKHIKSISSSGNARLWDFRLLFQWATHTALGYQDRFFSVHTATHYALYLWQPSGLVPAKENPEEEAEVQSELQSEERPQVQPEEQLIVWDITDVSSDRRSQDPDDNKSFNMVQREPKVIRTFTHQDLAFLGIRQGVEPKLREIFLDEANLYVHEEDHRWLQGKHVSDDRPHLHDVRSTSIPLSGIGPHWVDECGAEGDEAQSFCPRAGSAKRLGASFHKGTSDHTIKAPTWPGWAACWRHENLPNTTVSEVVDTAAGVRIAARQLFDENELTSFVRSVDGAASEAKTETKTGKEDEEEYFAEDLWWKLLGKGRITGDERWVVGEDRWGESIVVVRF
ncbi:hypothetical protein GGS21DRAFT_490427 [Xylaria nigripes]|nr:hypothetical protein GGS21DRAFT_490427 [Xylaria nigripes]